MEVPATQGAFGASLSPLSSNNEVLDKEAFLQLLVTQLSNQDPLNPMDGQEFAAQLAQFSSVEQLINIGEAVSLNGQLTGLLAESTNAGIAAGLIGTTIEATGNQIGWSGEGEAELSFTLPKDAASVQIAIKNEAGVTVRTLDAGSLGDGEQMVPWDGTDENGATVAEGLYSMEITATDNNGDTVHATPHTRGTVDRISFGPEGTQLWIGKLPILLSSVTSVES